MCAANLQREGLYLAVAMMNRTLVHKGLLSTEQVDSVLRITEAVAQPDRLDGISTANRDAACFPIRVLQLANREAGTNVVPPFSKLARTIGETKEPTSEQP